MTSVAPSWAPNASNSSFTPPRASRPSFIDPPPYVQVIPTDISHIGLRDKQATLTEHYTLFLNKNLFDNAPDEWDESAIATRAKRLCRAATRVWPRADGFLPVG